MPPGKAYVPRRVHDTLGPDFSDPVAAASFPQLKLRYRNDPWAARVGLDALTGEEWITHFGRFEPLPRNLPQPLALRYHGHQFRSYNPDLGDGRGFLFAQMLDHADSRILDLGTKGSGQTPYSRQGDGRLTLKGGVRELLATTMLEALGVNTSKTFSLIETGENLFRNDEPSPTRSSVLVRLSHSNIRIGTFQRLAFEGKTERIQQLVDHVLQYYFTNLSPEVLGDSPATRAVAMLTEACRRIAETGAAWMAAGFVHGVLNTDNINITGESFDYGPYRFLPHYDPQFTAAYFDHTGLYAYGRQPDTLVWNLTRLAECLTGLAERDVLVATLETFPRAFEDALCKAICRRLNLTPRGHEDDLEFISAVFVFLHGSKLPFERFFFDWFCGITSAPRAQQSPMATSYQHADFQKVQTLMERYAPATPGLLDHPYFSDAAPCTLLIDEIESIWGAIADHDHWKPLEDKLGAISRMAQAFDPQCVLAP